MGTTLGGNGQQNAEINLTPMIDILLVLIIIFMVITPPAPRGLQTLVPQAAQQDQRPPEPAHDIVITVHAGGAVLLNQERMSLASLEERLMSLFRNGGSNVVFVRGDRDLEFGQIAEVIDLARGAGINRVALMTE